MGVSALAKSPSEIALEVQQQQVQELIDLASTATKLYREINDNANDALTINTKERLAQTDEILRNSKENQERILRQMQNDQMGHSGILDKAKEMKMYHDQLQQLKQDLKKQQSIQRQQQKTLNTLIHGAAAVNDEIVRLTRRQDYNGVKEKFADLGVLVTAIRKLKFQMAQEDNVQQHEKQLIRDTILRLHGESPSPQHTTLIYIKGHEMMQLQNLLFSEGVDCYKEKFYAQAKLLFDELSQHHDPRAEGWLRKVDRAITRELLKSPQTFSQEQKPDLEGELKARKELYIIKRAQLRREQIMSEELEQQKRLYEDERLKQLHKLIEARNEDARLERLKARAMARLRIEEERQVRLKSDAVAQAKEAQEQVKNSALLEKQRQEDLQRQAKEREEQDKKDELTREENERREKLLGLEEQRQAQLEARREAVRKQLEDGVEAMYQDALGLYKEGDYAAASKRFKDVEDIIPGYKRSQHYLDDARQKASAPLSMSRQANVSKALDIFDPNAK